METQERIQMLLDYSGLNPKQFAERINTKTKQAIYELQKGNTKNISQSMASKILSCFPEINKLWLLTGEGEMLIPPIEKSSTNTVPLLPVSAQGGTLSEFSEGVYANREYERIASPVRHADYAITVNGDSMRPEYPSGSVIFIRKVNERAFLDWGKTYVLDTVNGTVIKKLMPADTEDKVRCVSLNPDFPPYDLEWEHILSVYRVLACLIMK